MPETTMTIQTNAPQEPKKCPYCDKPIENKTTREILSRGYDHVRRKQVLKREYMDFCSPQCGGNYQMGCEG